MKTVICPDCNGPTAFDKCTCGHEFQEEGLRPHSEMRRHSLDGLSVLPLPKMTIEPVAQPDKKTTAYSMKMVMPATADAETVERARREYEQR